MKTNKLLSYITLGVLFSGVAFADVDVLATDGAETQSTDAILAGESGPTGISGVTGSKEETLGPVTMGQGESSDAGFGESNGIWWAKSKDQVATDESDLARVRVAEKVESSDVSDAGDGKKEYGQLTASTDQGTTDSAEPLRDTGTAVQDRASPEEVVVTGQRRPDFAETAKSSGVSDAGDGESSRWEERVRSKDQGTADGDLTRVQDSDRKVTKDRKGLRALEAEDNSKDSQDRASPQEIIVTGSK